MVNLPLRAGVLPMHRTGVPDMRREGANRAMLREAEAEVVVGLSSLGVDARTTGASLDLHAMFK